MRISDWSSDVCSSDLMRIMIRMANDADYALTYFATMAAGYVALPSSAQLTAAEAAYLLANSGSAAVAASAELRSEEHTSELQSLMRISYAVFCLKKKKKNNQIYYLRRTLLYNQRQPT